MRDEKTKSIVFPVIISILLTAIISTGLAWYVASYRLEVNQDKTEKQAKEAEPLKENDGNKTEKDIISWKKYENKTYGISFQYPKNWDLLENSNAHYDGSNYIGGNLFSSKNIVLNNKDKGYAIAFNVDSNFGRGGTCAKRAVFYETSILETNGLSRKISFEKVSDIMKKENPEGDMCTGLQKGFVIRTNQILHGGQQIVIHSENNQVSDDITEDAVKMFEEIMKTIYLVPVN